MGGSAALDLISELPRNLPYNLYFDNLFTRPASLVKKSIGATGTVRPNQIELFPFKNIKSFKKRCRGSFEYQYDKKENLILVRWNNNNVVAIASNTHGVHPLIKDK